MAIPLVTIIPDPTLNHQNERPCTTSTLDAALCPEATILPLTYYNLDQGRKLPVAPGAPPPSELFLLNVHSPSTHLHLNNTLNCPQFAFPTKQQGSGKNTFHSSSYSQYLRNAWHYLTTLND